MRSLHVSQRVLKVGVVVAGLALVVGGTTAAGADRLDGAQVSPAAGLYLPRAHGYTAVGIASTAPSTTRAATRSSTTTTTTAAPSGSCHPLRASATAGGVLAIGDSVLIDVQPALVTDVPGIVVNGLVGRQWYQGIQLIQQQSQLPATVVIELGTNGPITATDFTDMMQVLGSVSRVIFVTNFVPDYWQNPNNAVIEAGAAKYKNAVVANWEALAAQNPDWFYGNGPHMPPGGAGAKAMACLIAGDI